MMVWGAQQNPTETWISRLNSNDPTFTSLHILSFRRITSSQFEDLFDALARNNTLIELYCSGHSLEFGAMQSLTRALKINQTLQSLNVGNAELGKADEGRIIEILCEGIAANCSLKKLDLENKGLFTRTAQVIASALIRNQSLAEINLSRNGLDDDAITLLVEGLRGSKICKLDLAANIFGSRGATAIGVLLSDADATLTDLNVSDNTIGVAGGVAIGLALSNNKRLTALKLCHIFSASNSSRVSHQDSSEGDSIADAIANSLKNNHTLQHLWLIGDSIGLLGAQSLGSALEQNYGLIELRLRENSIDDDGAIAIATGIKHNQTLKNIELGMNHISSSGFAKLIQSEHLRNLGLFNNSVHDLTLSHFSFNPPSKLLTMDLGCNAITKEDFGHICQALSDGFAPFLTTLEIGGNVGSQEDEQNAWQEWVLRVQKNRKGLDIIWKMINSENDQQ